MTAFDAGRRSLTHTFYYSADDTINYSGKGRKEQKRKELSG